jgi:hypothetical protein
MKPVAPDKNICTTFKITLYCMTSIVIFFLFFDTLLTWAQSGRDFF